MSLLFVVWNWANSTKTNTTSKPAYTWTYPCLHWSRLLAISASGGRSKEVKFFQECGIPPYSWYTTVTGEHTPIDSSYTVYKCNHIYSHESVQLWLYVIIVHILQVIFCNAVYLNASQVCPPSLHISLGVFSKCSNQLERTCRELDLQLACNKSGSETTGGRTFMQYMECYRELRNREEKENVEVQEAENKEYLAGLLILVCAIDDPQSSPITAQLLQDAVQQKQKAPRGVWLF